MVKVSFNLFFRILVSMHSRHLSVILKIFLEHYQMAKSSMYFVALSTRERILIFTLSLRKLKFSKNICPTSR